MRTEPGQLITLEGIDNCGKSLQAGMLANWLRGQGRSCILCREPGGTALGERLRDVLLDPQLPRSAIASTLLFAAGRSEHVREVIRPALQRGDWVICDRFADSTAAYQGGGSGLPQATLDAIAQAGWDGIAPDLTLLLRISPAESAARGSSGDFFDRGADSFMQRVADRYDELAKAEPKRITVIDATLPANKVAVLMQEAITRRLPVQPQ